MGEKQLMVSARGVKSLNQIRKLLDKSTDTSGFEKLCSASRNWLLRCPVTSDSTNFGTEPSSQTLSGLDENETETLASALLTFLSEVLRSGLHSKEALLSGLKDMKFPPSSGTILTSVLCGDSSQFVTRDRALATCTLNKMISMEWRLDVIITSHVGKKILEPMFLVKCKTTNGTYLFEVPIPQFHKLRYAVATVFQEMDNLRNKKIMAS